jgi:lysophospholipase L1-like esterase
MSEHAVPESTVAIHQTTTDRRQFLTGFGVAACAGLVAAEESSRPASAADQKPAPKAKRLAPTSGIDGVKELLGRKDPLTWVFTGDSITHGALHTKGWRSYPEHFAERVRWELKRMRDIVVNTGVSGDRAQGLLPDIDWRVLHLKPDVVSVMLGINDSAYGEVARNLFKKDLTAIVTKIMAAGAIPVLNTPNTVYLKNATTQADLPAYAQVVRDVAKATKAGLIDHYAHWEESKADQEALLKWLDDQSIHPNFVGHRELAKQIFRELDIFDEESPTCQLEVP